MNTIPIPRWRRLPVFFLLDTSQAMVGTLEVAMMQGILQLRNVLQHDPLTRFHVYLSCIPFPQGMQGTYLQSLALFTPHPWHAVGECCLEPALKDLEQALQWDILAAGPAHPGDYAPFVVLILGDTPVDHWQESASRLSPILEMLQARIVTLVIRRELRSSIPWLHSTNLLLAPAHGATLANFFEWTTNIVLKECTTIVRETHSQSGLPPLPYGIIRL